MNNGAGESNAFTHHHRRRRHHHHRHRCHHRCHRYDDDDDDHLLYFLAFQPQRTKNLKTNIFWENVFSHFGLD